MDLVLQGLIEGRLPLLEAFAGAPHTGSSGRSLASSFFAIGSCIIMNDATGLPDRFASN